MRGDFQQRYARAARTFRLLSFSRRLYRRATAGRVGTQKHFNRSADALFFFFQTDVVRKTEHCPANVSPCNKAHQVFCHDLRIFLDQAVALNLLFHLAGKNCNAASCPSLREVFSGWS